MNEKALPPPKVTLEDLGLKTYRRIQEEYITALNAPGYFDVDLKLWLPGLKVRPLAPGELLTILGATGIGKTFILQQITKYIITPTILFEMELPGELLAERWLAIEHQREQEEIEKAVLTNSLNIGTMFDHVYTHDESGMQVNKMRYVIDNFQFATGKKPRLILVDYIGLMDSDGRNSYERVSNAIRELKIIAKNTRTSIIVVSQINRDSAKQNEPLTLFSAKDSGAVENSAGIVLGMWRPNNGNRLHISVLKQTKDRKISAPVICEMDWKSSDIFEIPNKTMWSDSSL